MNLEQLNLLSYLWIAVAIGSFILLQFLSAPYGRHVRQGWGAQINNKLGWVLMESPSLIIVLYFFVQYDQGKYASLLSLLWIVHYFNRTILYPLRIRTQGKKMPLVIVFSAILFNCVNAGLNGYYLAHFESYPDNSFTHWNFIVGILLFLIGFLINQKSDRMLINLRSSGETGYKIPRGFLFDMVSCPNLLGELIQWLGFALMAWNLPALTFFIWTFANLVPRAVSHHKWYLKEFDNYPKNRKAIVPKIL